MPEETSATQSVKWVLEEGDCLEVRMFDGLKQEKTSEFRHFENVEFDKTALAVLYWRTQKKQPRQF